MLLRNKIMKQLKQDSKQRVQLQHPKLPTPSQTVACEVQLTLRRSNYALLASRLNAPYSCCLAIKLKEDFPEVKKTVSGVVKKAKPPLFTTLIA